MNQQSDLRTDIAPVESALYSKAMTTRPAEIHSEEVQLLNVNYLHLALPNGGDLYITDYGRPFFQQLLPENWHEPHWFREHREPLEGTSTVYRVRTRPVEDKWLDLVVKWCRVGEQVPFDTFTLNKFAQAEFNSPYEEFSLVMEMRNQKTPHRIRTHRPLAIYVPNKRVELWQTGRSESRIRRKKTKHRDVELDIYRQYILIYEWVKGVSITQACTNCTIPDSQCDQTLQRLTRRAIAEMAENGFRVLDMKPEHLIVRPRGHGKFLEDREKKVAYALVDFELLERTPEREEKVQSERRAAYLVRQRDRFHNPAPEGYPPHLRPFQYQSIDFVYGHTESTHGALWVVGRDPKLFDYFLPERWRRTPRKRLSERGDVYYTVTKDKIHLVWKISRVGEPVDMASTDLQAAAQKTGYNSPFEEFQIAMDLATAGCPCIYPRAIYRSGFEVNDDSYAPDQSRYLIHADTHTPDGTAILRHNHTYITIWGYWNGLDESLASYNAQYCYGLNLQQALRNGLLDVKTYKRSVRKANDLLANAGYMDLNFKDSHVLVSLSEDDHIFYDDDGLPSVRWCNLSLVTKRHSAAQ